MSWTRHFYQTATYSTFVLWYRKPSKRIPNDSAYYVNDRRILQLGLCCPYALVMGREQAQQWCAAAHAALTEREQKVEQA